MRRVVVTGLGFITSIGNSKQEVVASLKDLRTGIEILPELDKPNVPVRLAGTVKGFTCEEYSQEDWSYPPGYSLPRDLLRSMSPNAVYGYCAMQQAIADAQLPAEIVSNPRTGAMCASGGSMLFTYHFLKTMSERGILRCHPMGMPASISGTLNMNMVAAYKIKGASLGFSSACASSTHAFGAAMDHIRLNRQDVMFVAGAEDCNYWNILPFAGARALTQSRDPENSPRPFDKKRDGFAVTGGSTVLVLEELEHAKRRGAQIYAEAIGWGESSDGFSVMAPEPNGEGLARALRNAMQDAGIKPEDVDYINAHATGTVAGDVAELRALKTVFATNGKRPAVSSTKALSGHGLSLAGALEAAICTLSIKEGFTPVSAHITELDPECEGVNVVTQATDLKPKIALSNSSGFGGTNVVLAIKAFEG